ncbi:amidohydrolase family protein [Roseiterribacter gracilis]
MLGPIAPQLADGVSVIHAGTVLAVPGTDPVSNQTIVVRNGRIAELRAGFVSPGEIGAPDAKLIDLKDKFVFPGMIDAHIHLEALVTGRAAPAEGMLGGFANSDSDIAIASVNNARIVVENGFTTVRDAGSLTETVGDALKRAVKAGLIVAPRLIQAGQPLGPTGVQGDPRNWRPEIIALLRAEFADNICDGVEGCRKAVRRVVNSGADVIKIKASGGVNVMLPGYPDANFTDDELKSIVDTAHGLKRKVMAHAISGRSVIAALKAGVDSIEHGTVIDEEAVRLFRKTGAYFVPTMSAPHEWANASANRGVNKDVAQGVYRRQVESLRLAYQGGVKIALGTDCAFSPFEEQAEELILMVDAGMTTKDVLRAATVAGADLLGLSADIGTLEPGKIADLVAVRGNPLKDMQDVKQIALVMQGGVVRKAAHGT